MMIIMMTVEITVCNVHCRRRLHLYVSRPLSPDESVNLFCEPALFLINPAGLIHALVYSNATFARPDLKQIIQGIKMVQDNHIPIRGTF